MAIAKSGSDLAGLEIVALFRVFISKYLKNVANKPQLMINVISSRHIRD